MNLGTEQGLLALNERMVLALARRTPTRDGLGSSLHAAPGVRVHPSATLVGPVVLQEGAEVGEGVTIIGPTVVGKGSRVEAGATLAQCVIGSGQVVAPGVTLRHRVFLGEPDASGPELPTVPRPEMADGLAPEAWETPSLGLSPEIAPRPVYRVVKRATDATVAAAGLVLLAPLGLLIAALIKLESKGPIHFGHVREGMGGRPFRCWKYRTMIPGADQQQRKLARMNQMDGPQFKVNKDPRRTRMGRFLSATNLDEIPQLWNVLVGEMSLVGPRPSPFRENQVCVPWREGRLSVRPGVTGLWQICRHDRAQGRLPPVDLLRPALREAPVLLAGPEDHGPHPALVHAKRLHPAALAACAGEVRRAAVGAAAGRDPGRPKRLGGGHFEPNLRWRLAS